MPFRAFISADFGALPKVEAFAQVLRDTGGQLKLVDPDILHTTLKFLGDTDEDLVPDIVSVMEKSVGGVPPLAIALRGTGAFPSPKRINVVWVGLVGAEPLVGVAAYLDRELEALGFKREGRRWEPHVTVARVKGGRNLDRVRTVLEAHANEAFGEVAVNCIRLKRSVLTPEGPQYTTVAEVPLAATTPAGPGTA